MGVMVALYVKKKGILKAEKWDILYKDPRELKISDYNGRVTMPDIALEPLVESIKSAGINLYPIILDENNEVVAGGRRLKAALKARIPKVFCIRKRMTPGEKLIVSYVENDLQTEIHPNDRKEWIMKMRELGYSMTEIAEIAGRDRSTIYEWAALDKVPPIIRETDVAEVYKSLPIRKKRILRQTLQKRPFREDVGKALELTELAEKAESRVIEQIAKETAAGLRPDLELWNRVVEEGKRAWELEQIRIPRQLKRRLIKVFRYMGTGFTDGIIQMLQEYLPIKEKELGIASIYRRDS
jgi:ParB-like chromosome segregation protein Spo0J